MGSVPLPVKINSDFQGTLWDHKEKNSFYENGKPGILVSSRLPSFSREMNQSSWESQSNEANGHSVFYLRGDANSELPDLVPV